ncbi:MAG: hypothetical protein IPF82_00665 [Blastocatellia bacterium]|nr:hypothetical protein [Blastocatellia bacterium]
MVTGNAPFSGETSLDVAAAIISSDPAPLSEAVPGTPPELERIVAKALRKDRRDRYQSTHDLLVDLKKLKEELVFGERLERDASSRIPAGQPQSRESKSRSACTC